MLSRIAEQLYWIGRYTERAEDTARLLDVAGRAALEGSDMGSADTLAAVLGGVPLPAPRAELLARYTLDRLTPESVAAAVRQARENCRTIRDAVPSEMWEALNGWHLTLAAAGPADLAGSGAHAFLSAARQRGYLFQGVAEGTLPRTEGWDWLMLGRYLERLLFTARLVAVRAPVLEAATDARQAYGWTVLLRCVSAYEAYRATYRAEVDTRRVAEFLFLDDAFPRSVCYAARQLDDAAARVTDERHGHAARRSSGRLRADVEFRMVDELLAEGLPAMAARVGRHCLAVHGALVAESFARGAPA